jgi:hypothetical protein
MLFRFFNELLSREVELCLMRVSGDCEVEFEAV